MQNTKTVVFCTDGVFPHQVGGMQRHSKLLIEELAKSSAYTIYVIHPHAGVKVFDQKYNVQEHEVEGINKDKNYLRESYKYSKRVFQIVDGLPKSTIVYNQGFAIWHKAKSLSSRLITNPHGLEPFQALSKRDKQVAIPFKFIFKRIFRQSRYTVSLGGKLTEILDEILPREKITILPNAVNLLEDAVNKKKPDASQKVEFYFVARFAENKGIHILMQAIQELNESGYLDKMHFRLAGKGPLYEEYVEKYKFPNVEFLGFVTDEELEAGYRSADAYVFPTLFEGMPTVVLEAMRNYLPIIVSDTGATREQVDDENGYLLEPGNVKALKDSLLAFYQLPQQKKDKMSEASFARVSKEFTWLRVAEKHVNLFDKILKEL